MMRCLAQEVLTFYPRAWQQRYGAEVGDLIKSRPVRLRTVLNLMWGAADAWLHYRRVSGAAPFPVTAILFVAGPALWWLWNPGVRDPASLHGAWAEAAAAGPLAGQLQGAATFLFVVAAASGVLSGALMFYAACRAGRCRSRGQLTRTTAQNVIWAASVVGVPVSSFCAIYYNLAFAHGGFPVGPLGDAMTGGFFAPIVLALVLPLTAIAAGDPAMAADVRTSAGSLAVAAICNGLGWLFVAPLVVLGVPKASGTFVAAVAVSALLSVGMSTLVARSALRRGRGTLGRLSPG